MVYHLKQPLSEVMQWSPKDRETAWIWLKKQRAFEDKAMTKKKD